MGIAVLGPLTIEGEHNVLGRRDRVVLAALAVHPGDVVSAEALADVMWEDRLPPSWPKIVQGCVVRLRKVLGSHAIETFALGYRLTVPLDEIDAQRFERAVGRARELLAADEAERSGLVLADALTLWRGRPLSELEGWDPARIEAARLTELRNSAEELYVESALRSGQHRTILGKAQALVAEAPLRERRWILLATAQYQAGRQSEALRTLRQLRTVLSRELGLDPGPDIEALEQAILRQDPSLVAAASPPEPSPLCPYQGLKPYDVDDADEFFGRDADVTACLRKLADAQVLAVVGPSGCGKSSLVRAGVAAALRRDGRTVALLTPGMHPVAALAAAVPGEGAPRVLVVDQCEEVFSLCQDGSEREAFLTALTAHSAVAPLVLSFRADRMADVSSHPGFARVVAHGMYVLAAMTEPGLRTAIEEPARLASLIVEPGLVDLLVNEVADEAGALPLMSHALAETWQRREGRTLTVAGYRATGGIRGAVAQSAEQVYERVPPEQRTVLRDLLLRLVSPGPEGEPVRSRLPRRVVVTGPENDAMIDLLVGSRLVTSDDGAVELAHESLAQAWPRLRGWLDDDLEGQRILHHLAPAADSWNGLDRPDSELYRGVRLAKALDWQHSGRPTLTETEQDFLAQSKRLSEAELHAAEDTARRQIRVNRRLRTALTTAAVLLVGALIAGLVAVHQAERADQQAAAAEQAAVVADAGRAGAKAVIQDDIAASLLLAAAGARLHQTPESHANLLAVLAKHRQLIGAITTDSRDVTGLEVSPDGKTVALYDASGTLRLYDPSTGKLIRAHAPEGPLAGAVTFGGFGPVAFSPDSRYLAVGALQPTAQPVRLLDPRTLEPATERLPGFPRVPARATHVNYSSDGRSLAAVLQLFSDGKSADGTTVLVWDVRPGAQPSVRMKLPLPEEASESGAVISPDGERLFTSKPLAAYDVATGEQLFSNDDLNYWGVDVTPDGKLLALGGDIATGSESDPGNVPLISAATGAMVRRLQGHGEELTKAHFSHDGRRLVSTSADLRANVWDVSTGRVIEELQVGEDSVEGIGFSPDDKILYTATDGALLSWDLAGEKRYVERAVKPREGGGAYGCIVPAPGGRTIFRQGEAGIWFIDVKTRKATAPKPLPPPWYITDTGNCVNWHPTGERAATVKAGVITVWNTQTGQVAASRKVPDPKIVDLDYSGRDGSRIVIGQESGVATLLDSNTLEQVGKPVRAGDSITWLSASPDNRSAAVLTGGKNVADGLFVLSTRWVLLDFETGKVIRSGNLPIRSPEVVAFSPDGRHAAVGSVDGEVVVLDTATGKVARQPAKGHVGSNGLAYSADGSLLVATGGSVSLYDGVTGELLGSIAVPNRTPVTADFESDGHTLLLTSYDDAVYRWNTRIDHAIEYACRAAGRELTADEWRDNFGDRPYRKVCS